MLLMNIQCLFCKRIMIDYRCNICSAFKNAEVYIYYHNTDVIHRFYLNDKDYSFCLMFWYNPDHTIIYKGFSSNVIARLPFILKIDPKTILFKLKTILIF